MYLSGWRGYIVIVKILLKDGVDTSAANYVDEKLIDIARIEGIVSGIFGLWGYRGCWNLCFCKKEPRAGCLRQKVPSSVWAISSTQFVSLKAHRGAFWDPDIGRLPSPAGTFISIPNL